MDAVIAEFERREQERPVPLGAHPRAVAEGDALGRAGRPGRVADHVEIVRADHRVGIVGREGCQPLLVPAVTDDHVPKIRQRIGEIRYLGLLILGHHGDAALRMAQHVRVRLAAVALVQRYPDQVAYRGAEEEVRRGQAVILQRGDPVAGPCAEGSQRVREPDAPLPGLAVGQAVGSADDGGAVGVKARGAAQRRSDIEHDGLTRSAILAGDPDPAGWHVSLPDRIW